MGGDYIAKRPADSQLLDEGLQEFMRTENRSVGEGLWALLGLLVLTLTACGRHALQQPQIQKLELDLGRSIAQIEARST